MRKNGLLKSLRGRYLVVAALVACLVLISASIASYQVKEASRLSTTNIEERREIVFLVRMIRNLVWDADHALNGYLLSPAAEKRQTVLDNLADAGERTRRLTEKDVLVDPLTKARLHSLVVKLQALRRESEILMALRSTTDRMFPAAPTVRETMEPLNREFLSQNALALQGQPGGSRSGTRTRELLEEVRYLWSQNVGAFRALLAELGGSFGASDQRLRGHIENVDSYYSEVRHNLERLTARTRAEDLGLRTDNAIMQMHRAAEGWHAAFKRVARMATDKSWRRDIPYRDRHVEPLFTQVWSDLLELDAQMEESAAEDVATLTDLANTLTQTLLALTAIALVLIVLGYVVFDRTVVRPIGQIARALKSDALTGDNLSLPRVDTRETQDLVDAFAEMRNQVRFRQVALEHQAMHDELTGLPNRTLLQDRVQQAIFGAQRTHGTLALVMMDLDRFKEINDTLGHEIGDVVLQQVGARLLEVLRKSDTVARLGGDEFALLLPSAEETHARQVAAKVVASLEQPFHVEGLNLYVGASLGIALCPEHGTDAQALMRRADVAMYVAKRSNVGSALYDSAQDQHSIGRLALVNDLRTAITTDTLEIHYQPKIDLHDGRIVGMEALLRWRHSHQGMVPPEEIIPMAEQTGLIRPLTAWVLGEAIRECAQWHRTHPELCVAVNLSVWNLQDEELEQQVRAQLERWGLPPSSLILEITESAMMAEPHRALETLLRLSAMGVGLSVDDYGTGFSSLAYLKSLPVGEIKIDKSFVTDMTHDDNDAVIVRSTIDLAHNLGLKVVAEGAETREIFDLLVILGCDTAQGYYIGQPMTAGRLREWLAQPPELPTASQLP